MARWQRHNHASTTYAVDLRCHLPAAGFSRTQASGGMEQVAGSGEDAMVFRMILENQVKEAAFRETVLSSGWGTEDQLNAISASASSFAQRSDVFGFIVFVQALSFV